MTDGDLILIFDSISIIEEFPKLTLVSLNVKARYDFLKKTSMAIDLYEFEILSIKMSILA